MSLVLNGLKVARIRGQKSRPCCEWWVHPNTCARPRLHEFGGCAV